MWQNLAVGAIVALAGLYALWYWMPAALRKRLGALRPALGKAPSCGCVQRLRWLRHPGITGCHGPRAQDSLDGVQALRVNGSLACMSSVLS